jgi:uncharacterized phiE125 gp8 family phage protein
MVYPYLYPVQMAYGIPSPRHPVSTVPITQPTIEPVSLTEAKAQLRILPDFNEDDALVMALVATGRRLVERRLNITLMATQFKATFADPLDLLSNRHESNWWGWSDTLELVGGPVLVDGTHPVAVTAGGVTLNPATYTVDADSRPSRIRLAEPGNNSQIIVTYWTGQATAATVPPTLKSAIMLLVGHLWANREAVLTSGMNAVELPMGVDMLLAAESTTGLY